MQTKKIISFLSLTFLTAAFFLIPQHLKAEFFYNIGSGSWDFQLSPSSIYWYSGNDEEGGGSVWDVGNRGMTDWEIEQKYSSDGTTSTGTSTGGTSGTGSTTSGSTDSTGDSSTGTTTGSTSSILENINKRGGYELDENKRIKASEIDRLVTAMQVPVGAKAVQVDGYSALYLPGFESIKGAYADFDAMKIKYAENVDNVYRMKIIGEVKVFELYAPGFGYVFTADLEAALNGTAAWDKVTDRSNVSSSASASGDEAFKCSFDNPKRIYLDENNNVVGENDKEIVTYAIYKGDDVIEHELGGRYGAIDDLANKRGFICHQELTQDPTVYTGLEEPYEVKDVCQDAEQTPVELDEDGTVHKNSDGSVMTKFKGNFEKGWIYYDGGQEVWGHYTEATYKEGIFESAFGYVCEGGPTTTAGTTDASTEPDDSSAAADDGDELCAADQKTAIYLGEDSSLYVLSNNTKLDFLAVNIETGNIYAKANGWILGRLTEAVEGKLAGFFCGKPESKDEVLDVRVEEENTLTSAEVQERGTGYTDTPADQYFSAPIARLRSRGWAEPTENYDYAGPMTRADFARLVIKAVADITGQEPLTEFEATFADVPKTHPDASYIYSGKAGAFWKGKSETNFGATDTLSRTEAACIFMNIIQAEKEAEASTYTPADSYPEWGIHCIRAMHQLGKIRGYGSDGINYGGFDLLNRADASVIVDRIFGTESAE